MSTTTYARIGGAAVAELFATNADIAGLFNPALVWVPVPAGLPVSVGWLYDGRSFSAPPPPPTEPAPPTLADLQAQLQALAAQLQALSAQT